MFNPWLETGVLLMQSQRVINLRLVTLGWGGRAAREEAVLMVAEKIKAAVVAAQLLMNGGSGSMVLVHYRVLVSDNVRRLTAS